MFSVGDTVVYRHHVCTIASVREAYFEGRDYFELRTLYENSLKLFVAVKDAKAPLMRAVMSRKEALALIDSILEMKSIDEQVQPSPGTTHALAERQAKEVYASYLKQNDPKNLIPIIKSVYEHTAKREKSGRRSTTVDKKFLDLAESLLYNELAVSLGMDREEVGDFVSKRISARLA